ncbi:Alpha-D-GlcNAc alpha-1,2-L-rhamnosyltransferase [Salipiger mucosus DSM 16094]|uniref:Alpha-D-GlcNAc alpha-1,2-L-rhamnosyltransferase n=2 Tax=Salipiger mucosus TaxID=263378 RepID=S9S457_9RHOB|nr:Alpha-D-GlcNAc alpha-1,2-L-rhamnosyltransferase [Salipiger mucosus DSM 16094]
MMGGIETHCAQILPRLLAQVTPGELQITLLARSRYVEGRGTHDGVRQIPVWSPRDSRLETFVHTFVALLYARFLMRTDIVHLHGIGPGLLAPLARLLGFRLLFTHHGEDYRRQKWGRIARGALRLGERLAVLSSHRVITVSQTTADRLSDRFPACARKITHIPNGLTREPVTPATDAFLEASGLTRGRFAVMVGRVVPEKGQDLLIEAFRNSALARSPDPWKLLIIGDADHESSYSRSIAMMAARDDRIVLAGRTQRKTVMALNAAAGLFVLPSYHEGLSIAALEAIHAGSPILLSDITENLNVGLPDRHYFQAGSIPSLTARLDADPAGYAVDEAFDLTRFDWSQIAARTLDQLVMIAAPRAFGRSAHASSERPTGIRQ